ncbi:MAG: methyltransferase domain-containing protein [Candidatus Omnitrophica bacterium]|nr:methyltransferase domain-containing protein [Candidatus Omnitrophota bacterium]
MRKIGTISSDKDIYRNYFRKEVSNKNILRYQWILQEFFNNVENKKVLEIGCGDGGIIQFLRKRNYAVGIDISYQGIENLKSIGIESYLIDISKETIPFENNFFDYVIALEVFEHLKSPQNAIEEIQRVCKKNGKVVLSIPNYRTGHKFIYRGLFTFRRFENYLKDNGFEIINKKQYGICPPLWSIWGRFLLKKINENDISKIPFTSKINRFFSSAYWRFVIPTKFCWLLVFEILNKNPDGAKKLYKDISDETKNAY